MSAPWHAPTSPIERAAVARLLAPLARRRVFHSCSAATASWGEFAQSIGMPEITFHSLRHTHASQLIDAGIDIATISKRLGHATPGITLSVYAHRFQQDDGKAAAAVNAVIKW